MIHRYLPREVGELLVYYQWLVLPFQARIALGVFKKPIIEYLFQKSIGKSHRPRIITSDQFRNILRRETLLGLGITINSSQYRHITIGIARRYLSQSNRFESNIDPYADPNNDPDHEDDVIDL